MALFPYKFKMVLASFYSPTPYIIEPEWQEVSLYFMILFIRVFL